jgi:hypothetical protein
MKTIIAKGRHFVGKLTRNLDKSGTRNCSAYLTWELREGENGLEFSASGEVWNHIKTDCILCGQCVDTLAELFPHDKRAQRILAVWQDYHLNGMKAGTPEQEREIADWLKSGAKYDYSAACDMLKLAWLYEVPLPEGMKATGGFPPEVENGTRGYRYGERWIYCPLPESVIAEIKSWSPEMVAAA